jgi:hypothetical protein
MTTEEQLADLKDRIERLAEGYETFGAKFDIELGDFTGNYDDSFMAGDASACRQHAADLRNLLKGESND